MKRTLLLVVPVFALVLAGLTAASSSAAARKEEGGAAASPAGDIEGSMRTIKNCLEELTSKMEDPAQHDQMLEAFVKLEKALMDCKEETPPKAGDVKEAEKAAFVSEYRRAMIDVLSMALQAESKFLAGKVKDAKKLVRDVEASKGKGHGKYKK